VIETPKDDHWPSRSGAGPRELLPWADPYIAGLMRRLERGIAGADDNVRSDPFEEEGAAEGDWFDDGWQEDAFMPRPLEAPRFHSYPPIVGGFPLLDTEP
jgi:hypothetical protein